VSDIAYAETGRCRIPARLDLVARAARELKRYCQSRCIDEGQWPAIELAFCEALNNAIEHGCREDPSLVVEAWWTWSADTLEIRLSSPNPPPAETPRLPEDELSESGRGRYLIDRLMESVEWQSGPDGRLLVMRKRLGEPQCLLGPFEESYRLAQNLSAELQQSFEKQAFCKGLLEDLGDGKGLPSLVANALNRLERLAGSPAIDVWIAGPKGLELRCRHGSREPTSPELLRYTRNAKAPILRCFREQREIRVEEDASLGSEPAMGSTGQAALLRPLASPDAPGGVLAVRLPWERLDPWLEAAGDLLEPFCRAIALSLAGADAGRRGEEQDRAQTQLDVAAEIQRSLLPSSYPDNEHCRVDGKCAPAMAVGGDYMDTIEIPGKGLLLVIADVMGKGVPAAMLATIFRTSIRSRLGIAATPGWLLSQINRQIHEELGHLNMFITAQIAFFDYGKKVLKLASAGHCPALYLPAATEAAELLSAEGIPLGIEARDIFEEKLFKLAAGDRVLFLTDGFYEAENDRGEMLGIERLAAEAACFWEGGLEGVTKRAFAFVEAFAESRRPSDDQTLLAMEAK